MLIHPRRREKVTNFSAKLVTIGSDGQGRRNQTENLRACEIANKSSSFTALRPKPSIINGTGEGNRSLVSKLLHQPYFQPFTALFDLQPSSGLEKKHWPL
jgi:hypothetical protein